MTTVIVDLRDRFSWEPGSILVEEFAWPSDNPAVLLGDIARTFAPQMPPPEGALVVTPGGLDPRTGGIRQRSTKYLGDVYQVGQSEHGLRPGDLLLPSNPEQPVLYVTEELVGSFVAGAFTALRVPDLALWVWGVLNSAPGKRLRTIASGGRAVGRARTSELYIPIPPLSYVHAIEPQLLTLTEMTVGGEEDAPTSWWRVADLRGTEWRFALATPHPELFEAGFPLEELAREIRGGQHSSRSLYRSDPEPGDLPVADMSWLRTGRIRNWCPPMIDQRALVTNESDVLIAVYGATAFARQVPAGFVIDSTTYAVSLDDPTYAAGLARYLNGRTGKGARTMRLTGITVQRLSMRDVRLLDVTKKIYEDVAVESSGDDSLEERLGALLWN